MWYTSSLYKPYVVYGHMILYMLINWFVATIKLILHSDRRREDLYNMNDSIMYMTLAVASDIQPENRKKMIASEYTTIEYTSV